MNDEPKQLSEKNQKILDALNNDFKNPEFTSGKMSNVPDCVYHHPDLNAVGSTTLKNLRGSYKHFLESRNFSDATKKTMLRGRVFHEMLLQPQVFGENYVVEPIKPDFGDMRTKIAKEKKAQWEVEIYHDFEKSINGREVVTSEMMDEVLRMLESCNQNNVMRSILDNSEKEVAYFARCSVTGIMRKCKADVLSLDKMKLLLDVKSCQDATSHEFGRQFINMEYDLQMAYYHDIICDVENLQSIPVAIFACESKEPFENALYPIDESNLEVGRSLWRHRLQYLADIRSGKKSEGLPNEFMPLLVPAWGYDVEGRK